MPTTLQYHGRPIDDGPRFPAVLPLTAATVIQLSQLIPLTMRVCPAWFGLTGGNALSAWLTAQIWLDIGEVVDGILLVVMLVATLRNWASKLAWVRVAAWLMVVTTVGALIGNLFSNPILTSRWLEWNGPVFLQKIGFPIALLLLARPARLSGGRRVSYAAALGIGGLCVAVGRMTELIIFARRDPDLMIYAHLSAARLDFWLFQAYGRRLVTYDVNFICGAVLLLACVSRLRGSPRGMWKLVWSEWATIGVLLITVSQTFDGSRVRTWNDRWVIGVWLGQASEILRLSLFPVLALTIVGLSGRRLRVAQREAKTQASHANETE